MSSSKCVRIQNAWVTPLQYTLFQGQASSKKRNEKGERSWTLCWFCLGASAAVRYVISTENAFSYTGQSRRRCTSEEAVVNTVIDWASIYIDWGWWLLFLLSFFEFGERRRRWGRSHSLVEILYMTPLSFGRRRSGDAYADISRPWCQLHHWRGGHQLNFVICVMFVYLISQSLFNLMASSYPFNVIRGGLSRIWKIQKHDAGFQK